MRATVDRTGTDSHGRAAKIQVRRIKKGDLAKAREVLELAFSDWYERQMGSRPRQVFGGAQYVHHRWLMEPWGCFVAEEDGTKIVGTALAAAWGGIGIAGPVAVLTNYQNQGIGQQLLRAMDEFFEENKTALQGAVTYPTSPKHLYLYHQLGYHAKGLALVMSRPVDRRNGAAPVMPAAAAAAVKVKGTPFTARRFSSLEEAKKKATIARIHRITNAVCRGLDLGKEIEIVDGLALGDTLLLERGRDLLGFAIYHAPGVSEAPVGSLYVKFLALDSAHKRTEHLEQFLVALEELASDLGLARVLVPVYLRYHAAYSTLVRCGYQVDITMVRMQRGKQEDYEDPTHLVLDDWR
ncbi:MAG: GNAT family N-acetyltransferase [Candidatus Rokubacteria bacterium]|nr:GNAT family N-acetyltransferase [Candidatus Rokubacteria bacterium]